MALPRPRRRVAGLITGSLLLLVVGTNVQAGWLFVLASLLLGVVAAGWVLPSRMVRSVRVERRAPSHAFQGDPVPVDLVVRSDRRRAALSLSITDPYLAPTTVFVPHVGRGEELVVSTTRAAARRGLTVGAAVTVGSTAPFGVAQAGRVMPTSGSTLVYPRVVDLDRFPTVDGGTEEGVAAEASHQRGVGQDYLGIREYRPGDSPRHVHWPSSARLGSLMVREFERERPQRLAILVDTSADLVPEAGTGETPLDGCCSAAASIALLAMWRGQPVDLLAGRHGSLDRLEQPGRTEALEWLAGLEASPGLPLPAAAGESSALVGPASSAVLIFPTWQWNETESALQAVDALAAGGRRCVAVVVDAASYADVPRDGERSHRHRPLGRGRGPGPPVLPAEQAARLMGVLTGRCTAVFRVAAGRDLRACLEQPAGDGR